MAVELPSAVLFLRLNRWSVLISLGNTYELKY